MNCQERKDSILLYAADALEGAELDELRAHLDTGCPECAGSLAEAQALLALLPRGLPRQAPSLDLKKRLMTRIAKAPSKSMRIRPAPNRWDHIVLPASIAALLAVAVVLAVMMKWRMPPSMAESQKDMLIVALNKTVTDLTTKATDRETKLAELEKQVAGLDSMKFAELKGDAQPDARGRVFIDMDKNQWYFFTSGMKPAGADKTYELWLIADNKPLPAGTFNVNENGSATLLGKVPPLPKGAAVQLAVTDEPGQGGPAPLGKPQISGAIKD